MESIANTLLTEIAWEVCNQVGGIYTVIRSKIPAMMEKWGEQYCAIGPCFSETMVAEFEPSYDYEHPIARATLQMREKGFEVYYGRWLVTGKPRTILLNPNSLIDRWEELRYFLWKNYEIGTPPEDLLINQVVAFGYLTKIFLTELAQQVNGNYKIIAHFHEWMTGIAIPDLKKDNIPIKTVFTTHATQLGRYLAMNSPQYYEHLAFLDWEKEAKHFNIEAQVRIERISSQQSTIFTTVSDVTAEECIYLLGRVPDLIVPNGLNIERFILPNDHLNLHKKYKEKIHQFTIGHFFHNYKFELGHTLYFFTSGRYEYKNKGFDLTLEAMRRLNMRMQQANMDRTVILFIVTKRPYRTISATALNSRAVMEEVRATCNYILDELAEKLFYEVVSKNEPTFPNLNEMVDEYWQLRLRRTLQTWRTKNLPLVTTHNLIDDQGDDILNYLRKYELFNKPTDKVKIIYHPDFVSPSSPFFGLEYIQFLRGCNLGIFPSYYEPWGYTPLECIASGIPTVTSDLSGFGDYVKQHIPNFQSNGIYIVNRRDYDYNASANQLTDFLFSFVRQSHKERINQRNRAENISEIFDWQNFRKYYDQAHLMALNKK